MTHTMAYYRDAGKGPPVVCIHSSGSSSSQWRALTDRLKDRFRVLAVDLYGSGKTSAWAGARPMSLDDELALIEPVLQLAGTGFHLVGHSYGGAVALKAALRFPDRVRSLAVYEPVLFSLLVADAPTSSAALEILAVRDDTTRWVGAGDLDAAAARFVDYWLGAGTWDGTPMSRRAGVAEGMRAVMPEWQAAFGEATPLAACAALLAPTLLLTGTKSTDAARAVTRLLTATIPDVVVEEIDGVGHMAPLMSPDAVNPLIARFLDGHASRHRRAAAG